MHRLMPLHIPAVVWVSGVLWVGRQLRLAEIRLVLLSSACQRSLGDTVVVEVLGSTFLCHVGQHESQCPG